MPVAIVGRPNSGKSTLLNALLRDDRAIVSDIPGTTRDTIEETRVLGGTLFRFIDTAGLRDDAGDEIERLGIGRSLDKIREASIVIAVVDIASEDPRQPLAGLGEISSRIDPLNQKLIIALNKTDLSSAAESLAATVLSEGGQDAALQCAPMIALSAKNGTGLDRLEEALIAAADTGSYGDILVTNQRHASALAASADALDAALGALRRGLPTDLLAEDLRAAISTLGTITGEISTDEVLGEIFKGFCIGK